MPSKRDRPDETPAVDSSSDMEAEFEPTNDVGQNEGEEQTSAMTTTTTNDNANEQTSQSSSISPKLLQLYYKRLFPYHFLYEWLSYNPALCTLPRGEKKDTSLSSNTNKTFAHREFSFTKEISPGEETYIRYQSFKDQAEFEATVRKQNPGKIDIGAVFSHPPKDRHAMQGSTERKLLPTQRELVFDVDLTDYDGVRKCGCSSANICLKCWKMMGMAMKVMDVGLREDFGFQNIAWFYSGRRGVHAWVCDESARTLSDAGRSAVASYFEVNLGTDKNNRVEIYSPLHPALSRAYTVLEPMFIQDIIPYNGHGILATEESWTELLDTLPSQASSVKDALLKKWKRDASYPEEKWVELKRYLDVLIGKSDSEKKSKLAKSMAAAEKTQVELWPIATVFKYTYPRLDINVSKMQNHLLKSPFCIHPKTGRVCVPIDIHKVDEFNPFEVPTLPQLIEELDGYEAQQQDDAVEHDWQKTSLKECYERFQRNFLVPMWKNLRRAERDQQERQAALMGDF